MVFFGHSPNMRNVEGSWQGLGQSQVPIWQAGSRRPSTRNHTYQAPRVFSGAAFLNAVKVAIPARARAPLEGFLGTPLETGPAGRV